MATTDAEMLELINEVITRRLQGDGYTGYTIQQKQWVGVPIDKLFQLRTDLEQRITAATGGGFSLIEPFTD